MIYRRHEGDVYKFGLNWCFERVRIVPPGARQKWWFSLVLFIGRVKVGFRLRPYMKPYLINYSGIILTEPWQWHCGIGYRSVFEFFGYQLLLPDTTVVWVGASELVNDGETIERRCERIASRDWVV